MNWDKSSQRDTGCLPVALLGNRSWPRRVENSSTRANGEYNGAIRVVCWGEDGNMPKLCPWANHSLKWLQVAFVQEWKYLYLRSVQNITLSIQKGLCHLYVLLQLYVHILYLNIWFPVNISCNSPEHIKVASYFCLARPPVSAARPTMAAGTASKVNLKRWQQALFSHFSFWGLYAVVKSPAGRVWLTGRQGSETETQLAAWRRAVLRENTISWSKKVLHKYKAVKTKTHFTYKAGCSDIDGKPKWKITGEKGLSWMRRFGQD